MRVVVLRALGLGDLLTGIPALRAVRRAFPDADLTLAAPAALTPLALQTRAVDRVVDTAPLAPLADELHRADVVVNLHGKGPQSVELLQATDPGRLISFGLPGAPEWRDVEREMDRWCRLLQANGIPADPLDFRLQVPDVEPLVRDAVLVHVGAAQVSRQWPPRRWAEVARTLHAEGRPVYLTGGANERDLVCEVARAAALPEERVLAGRTDLLGLAALVAAARLLLSGDTGIAHLATAVGTPSVIVFGPNPPTIWGPPPGRDQHRVLWAGQVGDNVAPEPHPGLLEISVQQVLDAAHELLA